MTQRRWPLAALILALATLFEPLLSAADLAVIIVDGDTIAIGHEHIRLLDIDAPESFRSRCENELVAGLKPKQRLRELINGGSVSIDRHGHDRYRRTLAHLGWRRRRWRSTSGRGSGAAVQAGA